MQSAHEYANEAGDRYNQLR